mmetsp:Transcript_34913/g.54412  ORF Transcript_34913/g.54412 Transcript_34913/m.54412 type:complete len:161 (-) Transcript_34913:53-535(-)|eukprot:CAMPEP_0201521316 /NCGR_PEP_ID=MMETSP0161_2-20130828/14349_1 /ASSEMBLY_ACC=CAM_ASM_000251 /TAXON_ID=180227 /ORGANISM="Neoparamoeba aestuarina, Strain SoJaBio B1-5/56/2" /LENGTH=160 /DNA_ID=CAMNT_0047919933 /DNA_START=250 /DNA_END=732 /DNA_ORIENTATION=+
MAQISPKISLNRQKEKRDFSLLPLKKKAFQVACQEGDFTKVKDILAKNPEFLKEVRDKNERSGFHTVCFGGFVEIVKYFLQQEPTLLHDKDGEKWTGFHHACCSGKVEVVKYLLKEDPALLDEKDEEGDTGLNVAKDMNEKGVLEFLEYMTEVISKVKKQ